MPVTVSCRDEKKKEGEKGGMRKEKGN